TCRKFATGHGARHLDRHRRISHERQGRTSAGTPRTRKHRPPWYGRCISCSLRTPACSLVPRMEPAMSLGNNGEVSAPLILVVDDDEDTREVCAMTLRLAGFRTEEAGNGAVACERAFVLEPDAILLDHSMPVMDGREAARRLRADTRTHNAALVMMTGFNAATVKGREVRADGH